MSLLDEVERAMIQRVAACGMTTHAMLVREVLTQVPGVETLNDAKVQTNLALRRRGWTYEDVEDERYWTWRGHN